MTAFRRYALTAVLVAPSAFVVAPLAQATEVTIEASHDNSLFETLPDQSCGAGPLYGGETGEFGSRRIVLTFDVAGNVAAGSVITEVELGITVEGTGPFASPTDLYSLHRLQADWGEEGSVCLSGLGVPAEPGDATWTYRHYATDLWGQEGGDFDPTASGTVEMPTLGLATFPSQPGMVADVQSWLDAPSGNNGWIIIGNESVGRSAREFFSREFPPAPSLHIVFTSSPPSPPVVPDGTTGTPVLLSKLSPDGSDIGVSWDTATCSGNLGHHIIYGGSAGFPAALPGPYLLAGGVCDLGASSPFVWSGSPDAAVLDPAKKLLWMLVVADDGATIEGSWGRSSAAAERNGTGPDGSSGECGILDKSVTNTCGAGF
jgi:hypothetical protein